MGEINGSNESGDGGLAGPSAPTGRLDGRSGIEDDGRRSAEVTSRGYVAALDAAGEGVLFTDSEERIVDINRAFTEITGYAAVDVCGSTPRILASGRHDRPFWGSVWNAVRTTGCWKGEVWNRRKDGEVFPVLLRMGEVRDGAGVVSGYFGVLSDLTAVKESEERFERLAHHDALTHLPNRLLLRVRVDHAAAQARRGGRRMAIIVLGLDGFQAVNDSLGYVAGDEFLRGVAARLVSSVRAEATVARISGDEFAILLEDVSDSQDAGSEARNVLQSVARPLAVRGKEILLTGSAGISVFPEDGRDFDTLLRHADAALHRAKETGLIEQFGSWALGATCAQARLWQDAGLPPFKVAVNLSPREIPRPELAGNVAAALKASGLEPGRLALEITEGFLFSRALPPDDLARYVQERT